jgi:hypothetical protein
MLEQHLNMGVGYEEGDIIALKELALDRFNISVQITSTGFLRKMKNDSARWVRKRVNL